jgi:hypothetical protein
VWNTVKVPGSKKHELNPAILKTVPLEGRVFIIGQDSDGKKNAGVTAAAVMAAAQLKEAGAKPFYWKPPPGPGKGFDDYIEVEAMSIVAESKKPWKEAVAMAYEKVPEILLPTIRELRTDLTYANLERAMAEGHDLQEFILQGAKPNNELDLA